MPLGKKIIGNFYFNRIRPEFILTSMSQPTTSNPSIRLDTRGHIVEFPRLPLIMGVININDDSFSGEGTLDTDAALKMAAKMVDDGADIIDVGAESARTNREAISVQEEIDRLAPFLERFAEVSPNFRSGSDSIHPPLLSINTWRHDVAKVVLPISGHLLNDMSALPDSSNAEVCAQTGAALLIMHSIGEPKIAHRNERYQDILQTLDEFFEDRIALATAAGVNRDQLILDPGIDFAKEAPDNLKIYKHAKRLVEKHQRPVLLPVSRKTVIGDTLGIKEPAERDAGTVACIVRGTIAGCHIFRVHNVPAAVAATRSVFATNLSAQHPD